MTIWFPTPPPNKAKPLPALVSFVPANGNSITIVPGAHAKAFKWSLPSLFLAHLIPNTSANLEDLTFKIYPEFHHFSPLTIKLWSKPPLGLGHCNSFPTAFFASTLAPASSSLMVVRGNSLNMSEQPSVQKLWGLSILPRGSDLALVPSAKSVSYQYPALLAVSAGPFQQPTVPLLPVLPPSPQSCSNLIGLLSIPQIL